MFSLSSRVILAALMVMFAAGLCAQEGFPGKRVRAQHKQENWKGSPEAYLTEARVVIRRFDVEPGNRGAMRITGELFVDFEVETGHGVPSGQIMGMEVEVALYTIESDTDDNEVELVSGQTSAERQMVLCKTTETEEFDGDKIAIARFALPELSKPLPPGTYRLVAKMRFPKQTREVQNAVKWVRDLYGIYIEYDEKGQPIMDPDTKLPKENPVWGTKKHDESWKDIIENEACISKATLYMGNVVKSGGSIEIKSSGGGANVFCRDGSFELIGTLMELDKQRKMEDEDWKNKQEMAKVPANKVTAETLKEWKASHERSLAHLDLLVARAGGKLDAKELSGFTKTKATIDDLIKQIIKFEDDLTYKYWIMLDGMFTYTWRSIYAAGFNMYKAVDTADNTADTKLREDAAAKFRDPAAKKARDDKRETDWRFVPDEIKKPAFDYLRRSEETAEFDSKSYTRKDGKLVLMETGRWSTLRLKYLDEFRAKAQEQLDGLDMTKTYAMQKWTDAFAKAREMRDAIIAQLYCWELYTRQAQSDKELEANDPKNPDLAKLKAKARQELEKTIIKEWETEAGSPAAVKELAESFQQGKTAPSGVLSRYDNAYKAAKDLLNITDFAWRWRYKLEKKQDPPPPVRWKKR